MPLVKIIAAYILLNSHDLIVAQITLSVFSKFLGSIYGSLPTITLMYGPYVFKAILGILILTYSPAWGAYLMVISSVLFFFLHISLAFSMYIKSSHNPGTFLGIIDLFFKLMYLNLIEKNVLITSFGYLIFGLLTDLKKTARQQ